MHPRRCTCGGIRGCEPPDHRMRAFIMALGLAALVAGRCLTPKCSECLAQCSKCADQEACARACVAGDFSTASCAKGRLSTHRRSMHAELGCEIGLDLDCWTDEFPCAVRPGFTPRLHAPADKKRGCLCVPACRENVYRHAYRDDICIDMCIVMYRHI